MAEGFRLEAGPKLGVTNISPGFVQMNFADSMTKPEVKAEIEQRMGEIAIEVDVGEIVIRPTARP